MPVAELFGKEYTIPFDPKVIAGLQYRGINVSPDPETKPDQIHTEALQIQSHLDKLWADQKLRTVPGNRLRRNISPPSIGEERGAVEDRQSPTIPLGNNESTLLRVLPTPKINFNLRDIDPFKKRPLSTDL